MAVENHSASPNPPAKLSILGRLFFCILLPSAAVCLFAFMYFSSLRVGGSGVVAVIGGGYLMGLWILTSGGAFIASCLAAAVRWKEPRTALFGGFFAATIGAVLVATALYVQSQREHAAHEARKQETAERIEAVQAKWKSVGAVARTHGTVSGTRGWDDEITSVEYGKIKGDRLEPLRDLCSLDGLVLYHTDVTDQDLACIVHLSDIWWLKLSHTQIGDDGLAHLSQLPNLRRLWLEDTRITDRGIQELSELQSLEWLKIKNTNATDDCLDVLLQLPKLSLLQVEGTRISEAGKERVRERMRELWEQRRQRRNQPIHGPG